MLAQGSERQITPLEIFEPCVLQEVTPQIFKALLISYIGGGSGGGGVFK